MRRRLRGASRRRPPQTPRLRPWRRLGTWVASRQVWPNPSLCCTVQHTLTDHQASLHVVLLRQSHVHYITWHCILVCHMALLLRHTLSHPFAPQYASLYTGSRLHSLEWLAGGHRTKPCALLASSAPLRMVFINTCPPVLSRMSLHCRVSSL